MSSRRILVQDTELEEDDAEISGYSSVNFAEEVVYDEPSDAEIDINDVEGEIEVDASHEEWVLPMEAPTLIENHVPKTLGAPSVVLKTIDDLRMRPRIHVLSGKPSTKPPKHPLSRNPAPLEKEYRDEQVGMLGSSKMPSIRGALRMYADVALRNTELIRAVDVEEDYEAEEVEEDIQPGTSHLQQIFTHKDWPLYSDQPIDFQEASEVLCGAVEVDKKLICRTVPQSYKGEGTFLIDARAMKNRGDDQHGDGLGMWSRPTGRAQFYARTKEDGSSKIIRIDDGKGKILKAIRQVFKCMMRRYEHPVTVEMNSGGNRFVKRVYTAMYPSELKKTAELVVITYEWTQKQPCDFPVPSRIQPRVSADDNWEPNLYSNTSLPGIMTGYFGDIPIYSVGPVDFSHAATIILGGVAVDPRKIAPSVPQGYRDPGTFVIDMEHCPYEAMLRRDDNGIWGKPSGTSRYYVIDDSLDAIRIDTANRVPDEPHDIQILCKRYEHPAVDGRFVRKIYSGRTTASSTMPHKINLSVITYSWKGNPIPFSVQRKQNQVLSVEGNYPEEDVWPETSGPLPAKRQKTERKQDFEGESQADQELREAVCKKEYENQVRFAALLDRAEAFITRLEQVNTFNGNGNTWQRNHEQSTSQRRSTETPEEL